MGNLFVIVFLKIRGSQELLQICVQALASLITHHTNCFVHDLLTYEKTRKNWRSTWCFNFFLSNSPVAKHIASTKLAPASRNTDSGSQFCLAGEGNKSDVCPICLEKCAQRKMLCLDTGLHNSSPLTETDCASSPCFYWILYFDWWKPLPDVWKVKINRKQIIKLLFNCILGSTGTVCSIHLIHLFTEMKNYFDFHFLF